MKNFLLTTLLVLMNFGCAQISSKSITEVSQKEMNDVILIDVRTPEEFKAGHLENALNFNWYDDDFADRFSEIAKNETIYVYCKKGGRGLKAQKKLNSMGYHKVVNLGGDMMLIPSRINQSIPNKPALSSKASTLGSAPLNRLYNTIGFSVPP
jgi:rhodanese-related sulfurtransferase